MIYRNINQFKVKRIMKKRSIVLRYGLIALLFIVAILLVLHWGMFGIIVFSLIYGLWAINTPDE